MNFENKKAARTFARQLRQNWDDSTRIALSQAMTDHLMGASLFEQADIILTYIGARQEELDTSPIIHSALECGKQVLVPLTQRGGIMRWSQLQSMSDVTTTPLGLLEPRKEMQNLREATDGLCIVPGLLFGASGHRIGFGGGYYDRYLTRHGGPTLGLCPASCFDHQFPVETHDVAVQMIITETGCFEAAPDPPLSTDQP